MSNLHDVVFPVMVLATALGSVAISPAADAAPAVPYSAMPSGCTGAVGYTSSAEVFTCVPVVVSGGITLEGAVEGTGGPVIITNFGPQPPGTFVANAGSLTGDPVGVLTIGAVSVGWPDSVIVTPGTYMVTPGFPWVNVTTTLDSMTVRTGGTGTPGFHAGALVTDVLPGDTMETTRTITNCGDLSVSTIWLQINCTADFVGIITGTDLNVTSVVNGTISPSQVITTGGVVFGTEITHYNGGTGGTGHYIVAPAQTVSAEMIAKQGFGPQSSLTFGVSNISGTPDLAGVRFNYTHSVQ